MARRQIKKPSVKKDAVPLASDQSWKLVTGRLARHRGRPSKVKSLFKFVGEKIPYEFLPAVRAKTRGKATSVAGVYIAHDSMGYPRYIGRGDILARLQARRKAQVLELRYFSFFVVKNKIHEREVETIMIRAAGPLLDFNNRKVRVDIQPGDIRDFEPGTEYVERQYKRGRKVKKKRKSR